MQKFIVCVVSLFVTANLWANAKMPVVNIAAGGVSARDAFGETIAKKIDNSAKKTTQTRKRTVVARTANKTQPQQTKKQVK